MNTISKFMEDDHDQLDGIFLEFSQTKKKDFEKAVTLFKEFKTGLERHIVWEEEILFPIFEEKTGMYDIGPTAVMRTEHRQIQDVLERIHHSISERIVDGVDELEKKLLFVLKPHNDKEEGILYPAINDAIEGELEKEKVLLRMQGVNGVPSL